MDKSIKELYESPAVEVLVIKSEDIICMSTPGDLDGGGWL